MSRLGRKNSKWAHTDRSPDSPYSFHTNILLVCRERSIVRSSAGLFQEMSMSTSTSSAHTSDLNVSITQKRRRGGANAPVRSGAVSTFIFTVLLRHVEAHCRTHHASPNCVRLGSGTVNAKPSKGEKRSRDCCSSAVRVHSINLVREMRPVFIGALNFSETLRSGPSAGTLPNARETYVAQS